MFSLARSAEEAKRYAKCERIYHKGQELAWDGKEILPMLIEKYGGVHVNPAQREPLKRVFAIILWGELAAWKISAQLADRLEPLEAKMAATSQAHDEARHFYTMYDYLKELDYLPERLDPAPEALLTLVLETDDLASKLLGMQLMIETIALAIFQEVREKRFEPVLADLMAYYERDEARHVGLGMQYLPELMKKLSPARVGALFLFQAKPRRLRALGKQGARAGVRARSASSHAASSSAPRPSKPSPSARPSRRSASTSRTSVIPSSRRSPPSSSSCSRRTKPVATFRLKHAPRSKPFKKSFSHQQTHSPCTVSTRSAPRAVKWPEQNASTLSRWNAIKTPNPHPSEPDCRVQSHAFERRIHAANARHAPEAAASLAGEERDVRRRAQVVREQPAEIRRRKLLVAGVLEAAAHRESRRPIHRDELLKLGPRRRLSALGLVATTIPTLEFQRERSAEPRDDVVARVELSIKDVGFTAVGIRDQTIGVVEARAGRERGAALRSPDREFESRREVPHAVQVVAAGVALLVREFTRPRSG